MLEPYQGLCFEPYVLLDAGIVPDVVFEKKSGASAEEVVMVEKLRLLTAGVEGGVVCCVLCTYLYCLTICWQIPLPEGGSTIFR